MRKAWQRPDTVIVNEQVWNANARMADIVFPATTTLERNDLDELVVELRQELGRFRVNGTLSGGYPRTGRTADWPRR